MDSGVENSVGQVEMEHSAPEDLARNNNKKQPKFVMVSDLEYQIMSLENGSCLSEEDRLSLANLKDQLSLQVSSGTKLLKSVKVPIKWIQQRSGESEGNDQLWKSLKWSFVSHRRIPN